MNLRVLAIGFLVSVSFAGFNASYRFAIAAPTEQKNTNESERSTRSGILSYSVESEYQQDAQEIRVLLLVAKNKQQFQDKTRLVLTGEMSWGTSQPAPRGGSHTVEFHELLVQHGVEHHYDNSLKFPHRWDARWVQPTLEALLRIATQ